MATNSRSSNQLKMHASSSIHFTQMNHGAALIPTLGLWRQLLRPPGVLMRQPHENRHHNRSHNKGIHQHGNENVKRQLIQQHLPTEQQTTKSNGHNRTSRCDNATRLVQALQYRGLLIVTLQTQFQHARCQENVIIQTQTDNNAERHNRWQPCNFTSVFDARPVQPFEPAILVHQHREAVHKHERETNGEDGSKRGVDAPEKGTDQNKHHNKGHANHHWEAIIHIINCIVCHGGTILKDDLKALQLPRFAEIVQEITCIIEPLDTISIIRIRIQYHSGVRRGTLRRILRRGNRGNGTLRFIHTLITNATTQSIHILAITNHFTTDGVDPIKRLQ
mmetsp:Transcript_17476/g.26039  ORF Transcript_17476/g.26039 Transcript_17476/m.26039 type:complete len:334 (-) Transcript_17476:2036-3037(-)